MPGDDVDAIDWAASARLSAARGSDEFIVRERYAEEAPRVVVVSDRRPAMAVFPDDLPWLSKPEATRVIVRLVAASTFRVRGFAGYVDFAGGRARWHVPSSERAWSLVEHELVDAAYDAPPDNLERALDLLVLARQGLPSGTFVFVVSDFLQGVPTRHLANAVAQGWDVVPVVVQDPVWEQSFPPVGGIALPIVDAERGRAELVRLTRAEAERHARANEQRLVETLDELRGAGADPVVVSGDGEVDALAAFELWAAMREESRGIEWAAVS